MSDAHVKTFGKLLSRVASRHHGWELFSDWLALSAYSLFNSIHKSPDIEREYLKTAGRYKDDELRRMGELLGFVVEVLDETRSDFLGVAFQNLELASDRGGQFFTPDGLSRAVASMTLSGYERRAGRVLKINEPATGSGGMIIAAFNELKDADREWVHFTAQDIDIRCFFMTYIQLFLLGISAEVILGNTLAVEELKVWQTLGYYSLGMRAKLKGDRLLDALDSLHETPASTPPVKGPGQLALNF